MGRKDAEAITAEVAAVLRDLVSTAKFELIPLSNAFERAAMRCSTTIMESTATGAGAPHT